MSSAQLKSTHMSIGELDVSIPPSSLCLKLTVNEKAIRFYIQTLTHDQIILFGKYTLHHVEDNFDLAERVERIAEKDEALQLAFAKVIVGVDTSYSLAPAGMGNPDFNMLSQTIPSLGVDLVFKSDDVLFNKVNSLFRSNKVVHLNSSLLQILPDYLDKGNPEKLFVNVEQGYIDIIRFTQQKQLQLMNRYEFCHENDLIYYLTLCCEDLNIDRHTAELVISGEVDMQSQIYTLCYRYFANPEFIQQPPSVSFTKVFDLYPKHLHFNLYNLTA